MPQARELEMPSILQLAWPVILGNLGFSIVGVVDIKIVGSLGASAIAAVSTGHRVLWILHTVLIAVSAGTTALVARAWGANDRDEAARVARVSLYIGIGLSLVLTVVCLIFADLLVSIFQLEAQTLAQAAAFVRVLSLFNLFFAVSIVLGAALRAAGDTFTPLWVGVIANIVNIFLVVGLVHGRFGFPAMGVTGAALANALGFALAALLLIGLWLKDRLIIKLGEGRSFARKRVKNLLRIGFPAGIEQAAAEVGFLLFFWIVSLYGTASYVAYGIGVQILGFSFLVGFGFNIAASTQVGQLLGAGRPAAAARSGWRATAFSVGTMTVLGGVIILWAEPLASFMIADAEVVRLTVIFIYVLGAVQPLMALVFTLSGALRGAGDTRFPLIATLVGLVAIRGGFALFFAFLGLGVTWIFLTLLLDYVVKAVMLVWRFRSKRWQKIVV